MHHPHAVGIEFHVIHSQAVQAQQQSRIVVHARGSSVRQAAGTAVATAKRVVSEVAASVGLSWPVVHAAFNLSTTIRPWLRADANSADRRDLLVAAAQLTYLCGFMCFDDDLNGAAQHYYQVSLRLAAEAGDATGYAIGLRGLSVQARLLGHHSQAVDLAEAAGRTLHGRAPSLIQAFLAGQSAVAHAAAGDRRTALTRLTEAEQLLNRSATTSKAVVGAFHPAALHHQRAAVAACLGDPRGAVTALNASIRDRPQAERRSRAITLARLAELHLAQGHLEIACDTWHRFLDDLPYLDSRRTDRAFATLRSGTRPYDKNAAVRTLRLRAASLAAGRHDNGSGRA